MIETFAVQIPSTPILPSGNGAAVAETDAAAASSGGIPSADGFLQALEMVLGSSPLPTSLLGSTAIVQTQGSGIQTDLDVPEGAALLSSQDGTPTELDAATCERIACLLQNLGFQVKPDEIQELSPLDLEQLGTALEFVQRNLERGTDPGLVAENATLLLPRPWPLDDSTGAPVGTGEATAATSAPITLPEGSDKEIDALCGKIGDALQGHARAEGSKNADPLHLASHASIQHPILGEVATTESESKTSAPRHVVPGGTTSELIGRQVLEKIHVQLSEGHRELKLRLWPEELGEVRMSLKMSDTDTVHASLVVENDAVRQAILDATPQLKDALSRHGLDLERMSVSVGQKDAQEAGDGRGDGKDRKGGRRGAGGSGGWDDAETTIARSVELGQDTGLRNGRNTIDLWS